MFGKVRCDTRHVEVVGGVRIQSLTSCCGFKTAKNTRVAVLKQQKNTVSNKLLRFKISKRTQSTKKEYQTLFFCGNRTLVLVRSLGKRNDNDEQ